MLFCSCVKNERAIKQIENDLTSNGFTVTINENQNELSSLSDTLALVYQLLFNGKITSQLVAKGNYEGAECTIEALEFEYAEDAEKYFNYACTTFGRSYVISRQNVVIMSTSSTALNLIN